MRGLVFSATLMSLVGCVSTQAPQKSATSGPETCPKSEFSTLMGTQINDAVLPLTLTYRVIWPDDAVTTDFVEDRLEIAVDGTGVVTGLSCG